MNLREELEGLAAKATPGDWRVFYYDCGDCAHYYHNGPCPSIMADKEQDCAVVHWDGFKQKYWSAANGNQGQIEANAALIVALRNNLPTILSALDEAEEVKRLREENGRMRTTIKVFNDVAVRKGKSMISSIARAALKGSQQ